MRYFTKLTVAAALAITAMSAATSASALTFASFNTSPDERLVWNRIDNGTQKNGLLFTTNNSFNQNSAIPAAVASTFNFINYAPLAGMTNLAAKFTLYAVETGTPVEYQADGDVMGMTPFEIEVRPGAARLVIAPPPEGGVAN